MPCIINAESGTGLTNSADGSGIIKIQSAGKTTNALAWVNFNGTGTVAIRSSYNVSSITDNGVGDYTVNFATALSDANYCVNGLSQFDQTNTSASSGVFLTIARFSTALSINSVRLINGAGSATTTFDAPTVAVSIFGN